ncbi:MULTISPECIES: S8 family serine peptidase [Pseudoalteromonas]|uniref:S8 family serine peptidase n=1 Tax=Pseudoalteromonas TaxID=53246 RepID=UPI001581E42C|nr:MULTISPECIES: S8 family serine peptidase [Pseudoalteromonas]MDI4653805.1 S8 family serine peptidase [Pseudoalteromonas shioyasakiensis]NUJ40015.1 S8 family serine peptidase [Pseudoalteromonas sp. 0303]
MKILNTTLVSVAISLVLSTAAHAETVNLIIKYKNIPATKYSKSSASKKAMQHSIAALPLKVQRSTHKVVNDSKYSLITVEADSPEQAIQMLKATGQYESVEQDIVVHTPKPVAKPSFKVHSNNNDGLPNDVYYDDQKPYLGPLGKGHNYTGEYLTGHNFEGVWRTADITAKTIRVGVADGDFTRHPDIIYSDEGLDVREQDNDPFQTDEAIDERHCGSHGNGVSSVISAIRDNEFGLAGTAVNTEVVPARVLDCGSGGAIFADAIRWFAGDSLGEGMQDISEPVDVINLSLGAKFPGGCTQYVQDSIDYATQRGIPVIVSAGNDDVDVKDHLPTGCDGVIIAGATNWQNDRADFSNYGDEIAVSSHGTDVVAYSTQKFEGDEQVYMYSGTSFSAPMIASAVATAIGQAGSLSIEEIKFLLAATSDNYNENSSCILEGKACGAGGLNAKAFVDAAVKFKSGELSYIQSAFAGTEKCVSDIVHDFLSSDVPSCRLFEVSFNSLAQNKKNITYSLYRVEQGGELSMDNSSMETVIEDTHRPSILREFDQSDLINFDYGMRTCINGDCQPITIINVNLEDAPQCDS